MSESQNSVHGFIAQSIASERIFVFMKGTPDAPSCGFSALVVQVLNIVGVPYGTFDVLSDNSVREGIKQFSEWPTIPQLYVDGEFIGGSDIVREMYESGELQTLLEA
ncbi:MAG: Grx4 family monothiol glutaredoxin [Alphaproteobacteria bacterium]|nr:Grx4 family monothiol glutaredoxin [Alphaproteobacteria bacterium]